MNYSDKKILILGIGNLLWADEGFGVRAVEEFNRRFQFSDNVTIMDGGTQGLALIPFVRDCDVLIIFDAIDYGLDAGTMKIIEDGDVPSFLGAKKMSLHQTGFQEVLATSQFMGWQPLKIILIGVQPQEIDDYGGSLRPIIEEAINPALEIAFNALKNMGVFPLEKADIIELGPVETSKAAYESMRPSEEIAYRHGDARFINMLEDE